MGYKQQVYQFNPSGQITDNGTYPDTDGIEIQVSGVYNFNVSGGYDSGNAQLDLLPVGHTTWLEDVLSTARDVDNSAPLSINLSEKDKVRLPITSVAGASATLIATLTLVTTEAR
jgi:hypothetical protein